jgi:hypothetical protein
MIHKRAADNLEAEAICMRSKALQGATIPIVGDVVQICIPCVDAPTLACRVIEVAIMPPSCMCVYVNLFFPTINKHICVMKITQHQHCRLSVNDGVINVTYKVIKDADPYTYGLQDVPHRVNANASNNITLRRATTCASRHVGQGMTSCKCKCINKRYKCVASDVLCNSRCNNHT